MENLNDVNELARLLFDNDTDKKQNFITHVLRFFSDESGYGGSYRSVHKLPGETLHRFVCRRMHFAMADTVFAFDTIYPGSWSADEFLRRLMAYNSSLLSAEASYRNKNGMLYLLCGTLAHFIALYVAHHQDILRSIGLDSQYAVLRTCNTSGKF